MDGISSKKHTMSVPTRVYFDVENTLRVSFISGIQRVVRELSKRLNVNPAAGLEFIPVVYCPHCQGWRKLSIDETKQLQKTNFGDAIITDTHPYYSKLARQLLGNGGKAKLREFYGRVSHPGWHKGLLLPKFEPGSIFLDLDASWHNKLKRSSLLPALKRGGVNIATIHYDIIPILFPELMHEDIPQLFTEYLNAQIWGCDLFICISRNSENDLLIYCRNQFPEKKLNTTTIKLGADVSCDSLINDSWPLPEGELKFILCVGTIEPRKNHNLLLDAFDILSSNYPDINLVIVGRKGWHSENTVFRIQQHKCLNKRLFWLSGVSDDELSNLYINAYLTVVPSLYEGFGLPVTEALQRGSVTLSSDSGALTEAGGEYVEYFDPDDTEAFANLLESYLNSDKITVQKEKLSNYQPPSWAGTAKELLEILEEHYST